MFRIFSLLLALFSPSLALAQSVQDAVSVSVIPGWRQAEGRHVAGLKIALAPGWKTYWRVPGDAGIPPEIDLSASRGIRAMQLQWPVPEPFDISGLRSLGYKGTVILPMHLAVGAGDVQLSGMLELGVCKEICMPVHIPLQALLPERGPRDAGLAAALIDRPLTAAEAGGRVISCRFSPSAHGFHLDLGLALPPLGANETVVVELTRQDVWVAESLPVREGNRLSARAELILPHGQPAAIDRSKIRITVVGEDQAVELVGCTA